MPVKDEMQTKARWNANRDFQEHGFHGWYEVITHPGPVPT